MKFKIIVFVLVVFISIVGSYLFFKDSTTRTERFVVGTAAGYAPFVSVNQQGNYEGFDIDVANALAQKLDKQLVLKDLGSMTALFIALDRGTIDAIIWGLSITQDRLKKIAMINYQGEITTSYPLLFWEKIPANISNITDMKGMTICVEPNSSQDGVLSKYSLIIKKPTEKVDDALLNIQYGKCDAAFVEPAIAKKFKNKYPQIKLLDVTLAPEDQVHGVGIAIKKENASLIKQVQNAVDELKQEGTIKQYEEKWEIE